MYVQSHFHGVNFKRAAGLFVEYRDPYQKVVPLPLPLSLTLSLAPLAMKY